MNSIKYKRAFPAALAILAVTASALVSTPSAYAGDGDSGNKITIPPIHIPALPVKPPVHIPALPVKPPVHIPALPVKPHICLAGYTCFLDYETQKWGSVEFDNNNWTAFGWNDRADYFINHGRTHNICFYEHAKEDPRGRGERHLLKRGQYYIWRNIVSSNRWTKGSGC